MVPKAAICFDCRFAALRRSTDGPRYGCEQPDISELDTEWFCCIGTALGRQKAEMFADISCRTSKIVCVSVAFCWSSGPPTGGHNVRMLTSTAGRTCPCRYSRYGVNTSSIHFMNARTRRDKLLRCATTRDTASALRRKSGMISTSAPLFKYRPIPRSGA
jgi:hypothetical protein